MHFFYGASRHERDIFLTNQPMFFNSVLDVFNKLCFFSHTTYLFPYFFYLYSYTEYIMYVLSILVQTPGISSTSFRTVLKSRLSQVLHFTVVPPLKGDWDQLTLQLDTILSRCLDCV